MEWKNIVCDAVDLEHKSVPHGPIYKHGTWYGLNVDYLRVGAMWQIIVWLIIGISVVSASLPPSPLKLLIAGAPASGKGTQCIFLKNQLNLVHLSTGDMLRDEVKRGTTIGVQAQQLIDDGQLVPDQLLNTIVCDRLQSNDCSTCGWILDGFPRTKSQCQALLQAGHIPDAVIYLHVHEDELIERVRGRIVDPVTGVSYHMTRNIPEQHILSRCVRRSDDCVETLQRRLEQFRTHIGDILDAFKEKVLEIDGALPTEELTSVIMSRIRMVKGNT